MTRARPGGVDRPRPTSFPVLDQIPELTDEAEFNALSAVAGVTYEDVVAELRYRILQRAEAALGLQRRAAAVNGVRRVMTDGEVDAQVDFQIQPIFYHYWGMREGYECWEDRQFVREMKRDNPEIRVQTVGKCGAETVAMARNRARRGVTGRRGRWAL